MPKNPLKGFARRKSQTNVLDLLPEAPASAASGQSSFRVLERPASKVGFDGGDRFQKRVSSGFALSQTRGGKSAEDLGASTNRSVQNKSSLHKIRSTKAGQGQWRYDFIRVERLLRHFVILCALQLIFHIAFFPRGRTGSTRGRVVPQKGSFCVQQPSVICASVAYTRWSAWVLSILLVQDCRTSHVVWTA